MSEDREVRPWDFLNPNTAYVTEEVAEERLTICKACSELIQSSTICKKCGCFMNLKVKLERAACPLKKW